MRKTKLVDEVTGVEAIRVPSPIKEYEELEKEVEVNKMVTPIEARENLVQKSNEKAILLDWLNVMKKAEKPASVLRLSWA